MADRAEPGSTRRTAVHTAILRSTIRADSRGERLVVSADGPIRVTDIEGNVADALASFGEEWARRCGVRAITAAPSVWCSWYHYYLEATPADIEENLVAMDRLCLPVDVVQIDSAVAAYRRGLALVRQALGPDVYVLGCGAPMLPSVGFVDAMRASADVINPHDEPGTTGLRGERAIAARSWQHRRFWVNEPACLIARPTFPPRRKWADTIERLWGLRSASDRIDDLDDWGCRRRGDCCPRRPSTGGEPVDPKAACAYGHSWVVGQGPAGPKGA